MKDGRYQTWDELVIDHFTRHEMIHVTVWPPDPKRRWYRLRRLCCVSVHGVGNTQAVWRGTRARTMPEVLLMARDLIMCNYDVEEAEVDHVGLLVGWAGVPWSEEAEAEIT